MVTEHTPRTRWPAPPWSWPCPWPVTSSLQIVRCFTWSLLRTRLDDHSTNKSKTICRCIVFFISTAKDPMRYSALTSTLISNLVTSHKGWGGDQIPCFQREPKYFRGVKKRHFKTFEKDYITRQYKSKKSFKICLIYIFRLFKLIMSSLYAKKEKSNNSSVLSVTLPGWSKSVKIGHSFLLKKWCNVQN